MFGRLLRLVVLAVALSLMTGACGGEATPVATPQRPSPPPPPPAPTADVAMATPAPQSSGGSGRVITVVNQDPGGSGSYGFNPSEFTFKVGETVTFSLEGETEFHTFTVDGLGIDETLGAGETASIPFTFNKPGIFDLVCLAHPQMTGTITVQ